MSYLLLNQNATVTNCHSFTQNLEQIVREGDIVVVAVGKSHLIKGDWLKQGSVVIDCGINTIDDDQNNDGSSRKIVGDVDFNQAIKRVSKITPVPGGVGPMTVAMLLNNCFDAWMRNCVVKE